ncbi:REP-associated tyrosine transposase [Legionella bozemanae]|uniref:REP-associated tyrosine transposase n=1 Tax=Legionella bozemanae TaxID=447 RepID=UPI00216B4E9F|nr:transposase [Legionella bozemanae]
MNNCFLFSYLFDILNTWKIQPFSTNMVHYRRDLTAGGTYFFTLTLRNRYSNLLTAHIRDLGNSFREVRKNAHFEMPAFVILPEHLHVIWQLPYNDFDYSRRWLLIKAHFTRSLVKSGLPLLPNQRGEYNLWQRRFWEHRIRNEIDYQKHIEYIHYNPVKHGLVEVPTQWPYSSIHRFISKGIIDKNWGGASFEGSFGEVM